MPSPLLLPGVQLAEHLLAAYGAVCAVWVLARTIRQELARRRRSQLRQRLTGGGVVVGR